MKRIANPGIYLAKVAIIKNCKGLRSPVSFKSKTGAIMISFRLNTINTDGTQSGYFIDDMMPLDARTNDMTAYNARVKTCRLHTLPVLEILSGMNLTAFGTDDIIKKLGFNTTKHLLSKPFYIKVDLVTSSNNQLFITHYNNHCKQRRFDNEKINFSEIESHIINNDIENFLERCAPGGEVKNREYTALNPTRHDNETGSFKYNTVTGKWNEFSGSCDGGIGPISYYTYCKGRNHKDGKEYYASAYELAIEFGIIQP
jgi:hypothetical protein